MTNIAARVFWSLVLLLQLATAAGELLLSRGLSIPLGVLALACCVPMLGLIAQRRILSHNFWAGFFGIVCLYAVLMLLAVAGLSLASLVAPPLPTGRLFAAATMAALVHFLSFWAAYIYVYGSPQIWLGPNNSFKPKPLRGSA